jgi:uncharacterized membrane protein YgcG
MIGRLRIFALAGLAALLLAAAASAERVLSWDTEIYLEAEDSFGVIERIRWDFEEASRHGILRDIPVAYGRARGADYHIRLEVTKVTDADGQPHRWRVRRKGPLLEVRIGDPDRTVRGVNDYWIHYRVGRGILFLAEHDELYWNATGHDVKVPIASTRATVYLPGGLAPGDVEALCFTGRQGSIEQDCEMRAGVGAVAFEAERALRASEGLSVVVGIPKGVIAEPSRLARVLDRVRDYLSAWMALPALVLAGLLAIWRRRGRDPVGGAAVPVRYEPPEGLSPAEVGTVLDERADLVDVSATILDLAVRGYLRIEETESDGFLFLRDRDWRLAKLREGDDLRVHERALFDRLFAGREVVAISSLKNKFYQDLPAVRDAIYAAVSREDRFFPTSPERVRRAWMVAGIAAAGFGALLFVTETSPSAGAAFAASGLLVAAFSRAMPRRTRRGRAAYEQIRGFQEFVTRVDKDRLERFGGRTSERFERVLPYALVLGAADAWAEAFGDLYTEPPRWYTGRAGRPFHTRAFVDELGGSLNAMGQAMSSAPRSAGSGSSGFGGGGFSGGGLGGGGASSW